MHNRSLALFNNNCLTCLIKDIKSRSFLISLGNWLKRFAEQSWKVPVSNGTVKFLLWLDRNWRLTVRLSSLKYSGNDDSHCDL